MKDIKEYINESVLSVFAIMIFGMLGLLLCIVSEGITDKDEEHTKDEDWKSLCKKEGYIMGTSIWLSYRFESVKNKIKESKIANQIEKVANSQQMKDFVKLPKEQKTKKTLKKVVVDVLGTTPDSKAVTELWDDIKKDSELPKEVDVEIKNA